jgi:hypothetical protein
MDMVTDMDLTAITPTTGGKGTAFSQGERRQEYKDMELSTF